MAEEETKPTTGSVPEPLAAPEAGAVAIPADKDSDRARWALGALFGTREASIAFVALMALCILTIAAFALLLGPVQAEYATRSTAELKPGYLMLLIVTGALGGCLHAIHSLTTRVGAGTFDGRWFSWYLSRPLVGAGLALCFLPLVRAGFFTVDKNAQPGDALPEDTAFYLQIAIAVVVGMFSTHAINKLYDVVRVLLASSQTSTDGRDGARKPAATTSAITPPAIAADAPAAAGTAVPVSEPAAGAGLDQPVRLTDKPGVSTPALANAPTQPAEVPVAGAGGGGSTAPAPVKVPVAST